MRVKLIAPARKTDWGEDFWGLETLIKYRFKDKGALLALLALPTLAALTPPDVEVILTDENVEPIDFDERVDLVGITFMTHFATRAYEIADEFRARGIKVVLGGIHASMLPQEAIQHADSVVIGEAEETWPQLVRDFAEHRLQKFYQASNFPDLKNSPIPRWDLLKSNLYNTHQLQVGRGCPYNCDFCSVTAFNGRRYRHKPLENVLKEIQTLQEIDRDKPILFADDNFLSIPAYSRDLLKLLIPFKIKWWCQASINRLKDDELLELMHESGCEAIFVGFESISQATLDLMHKGAVNNADEYIQIVEKINSNGIVVFGSFILGNDADGEDIFEHTVKFIADAGIPLAQINILTPFPGTLLCKKLEKEGRILHKDWWKYNFESICFKPKMDLKALEHGHTWVLQQIYSYKALYQRFAKVWANGGMVEDYLSKRRKFLLIFRGLLSRDINRTWFALKGFWKQRGTSLGLLGFGISFHDYARKRLKVTLKGEQTALTQKSRHFTPLS